MPLLGTAWKVSISPAYSSAKYLKKTKWIANALSPHEQEKFRRTVAIIKTYASR